jgi:hypothetical protein
MEGTDIKGETYEEFVEKFKPKKTTDDCYTPTNVYEAVAEWVAKEYELNRECFARPFYPGGDYKAFDYDGKIVVDNPPFSILSEIIGFYIDHDIKFFLFAPALTLFSGRSHDCAALAAGVSVTYDNGAVVDTSFVTNLEREDVRIRTVPELWRAVDTANRENLAQTKKHQPHYTYPPHIVRAAQIKELSKYGIEVIIPRAESVRIRGLDSQKVKKKTIFGGGISYQTARRRKSRRRKSRRRKSRRRKSRRRKLRQYGN